MALLAMAATGAAQAGEWRACTLTGQESGGLDGREWRWSIQTQGSHVISVRRESASGEASTVEVRPMSYEHGLSIDSATGTVVRASPQRVAVVEPVYGPAPSPHGMAAYFRVFLLCP